MNYLSRERAKELIREYGLSKFFIAVIDGKLDSPLDIYFGCPTFYYLNEEEQEAYKLGDILPLWEDAGGYMQYATTLGYLTHPWGSTALSLTRRVDLFE